VSRARAAQRALGGLLLGIFAVVFAGELAVTARRVRDPSVLHRLDLRAFLAAADLEAGEGHALYALDRQLEAQHRRFPEVARPDDLYVFAKPPFAAVVLRPLAGLSNRAAFLVVLAANGILFAACLALLWRLGSAIPPAQRVLLVAGVASFVPAWGALWQGQLSFVLLLALLGAWACDRRGRDLSTGACLALLALKPHLLLAPALLLGARRRWKALAGLAGGVGALAVLGLPAGGLAGLGAWSELARYLVSAGDAYGIHPRRMYTLRAALQVLAGSDDVEAVRWIWLPLSGLLAAALAFAWHASRGEAARRRSADWGLVGLAALLLGPHGYLHDTLLVVPAAAAVVELAPSAGSGWSGHLALAALGLAWATPFSLLVSAVPSTLVVVPVLLMLGALLAWLAHLADSPSSRPR
jgi:hypothetical protein